MINFFIYNTVTGIISIAGSTNNIESVLIQPLEENEDIAEGEVNIDYQYVLDGHVMTMTDEQAKVYQSQIWRKKEFDLSTFTYPDSRSESQILADAKFKKWTSIKAFRFNEETKSFTYGQWVFDGDSDSVQRLANALQISAYAPEGWTVEWTLYDNTVATLTQGSLKNIALSLATRTNSIYSYARTLRDAIEAAESLQDLELITWSFDGA